MINTELKHLTHLLNDLQNQSLHCVEAKTDFDAVLLGCELVALIRPQIAKKINLEVKSSLSFIVHLSEYTLRQALLNLIFNAADALTDKPAGHICIEFNAVESGLTIQVWDNGAGFPLTQLEQAIPSVQSCRRRSSGLGLAMTQQFIQQMGGQMNLSNRKPHGACVTLFLPQECIISTE